MTEGKQNPIETLSEHASFGGVQGFYRHASSAIGLPMRFAVFKPPQALDAQRKGPVPALFYLAGLTCTEETFPIKAGAQRIAAELGLILIAPDTSPRSTGIEGEAKDWDFGAGAGFYLNATQAPWDKHYRMEDYVVHELRGIAVATFGADPDRLGIFGHSMGGHGALTLALRRPGVYQSVSAFAPIAAPSQCPWGHKAFTGYLGGGPAAWLQHDASALMEKARTPYPQGILIDQGLGDKFLAEQQLLPERFEQACVAANQPLTLRRHPGYDHGYYFVGSFMEDHLRFHHRCLHYRVDRQSVV
jgi:S-formylglutathione hydrolase